jgi:diguanylate cyclase (GGDEF)-like protein
MPFVRVKLLEDGDAASARRDQAALEEAFLRLAEALADPSPEVFNGLAHAARYLSGSDAAWIMAYDQEQLSVLGRSVGPEAGLQAFLVQPDVRAIPLTYHGESVGFLSLWSREPGGTPSRLEAAFEQALASALGARRELAENRWLSVTDPLTALANRRRLEEWLPGMVALQRRGERPLGVLMLDLDHFKRVNDRCGHEVGDALLIAFARLLAIQIRRSDLAVRWGGEEFVVILPDTDAEQAWTVAEKIRQACERLGFRAPGGDPVPLTVSIGLAVLNGLDTPDTLIDRADQALYQAKGLGRNRTVAADGA